MAKARARWFVLATAIGGAAVWYFRSRPAGQQIESVALPTASGRSDGPADASAVATPTPPPLTPEAIAGPAATEPAPDPGAAVPVTEEAGSSGPGTGAPDTAASETAASEDDLPDLRAAAASASDLRATAATTSELSSSADASDLRASAAVATDRAHEPGLPETPAFETPGSEEPGLPETPAFETRASEIGTSGTGQSDFPETNAFDPAATEAETAERTEFPPPAAGTSASESDLAGAVAPLGPESDESSSAHGSAGARTSGEATDPSAASVQPSPRPRPRPRPADDHTEDNGGTTGGFGPTSAAGPVSPNELFTPTDDDRGAR